MNEIKEFPIPAITLDEVLAKKFNFPRVDNIDSLEYSTLYGHMVKLKDGNLVTFGRQDSDNTRGVLGIGPGTNNALGLRYPVLPVKDWKTYGVVSYDAFALSTDGELWMWGSCTYSARLPSPNYSNVPLKALEAVKEIHVSKTTSYGTNYTIYIAEMFDGSFKFVGRNGEGQAGDGTTTQPSDWIDWVMPAGEDQSTLKELVISSGNTGTIYWVSKNNKVFALGSGAYGMCGNGTTGNNLVWGEMTELNGLVIDQVLTGAYSHSGGGNGYVWAIFRSGRDLYTYGYNYTGALGNSPSTNLVAYIERDEADEIFAVGAAWPTVFKRDHGSFYSRGYATWGLHGSSSNTSEWFDLTPPELVGKDFKVFANTHGDTSPENTNIFLVGDVNGEQVSFTLGSNSYGSGGIGTTAKSINGVMTKITKFSEVDVVRYITVGPSGGITTYALLANGELWGCGYGAYHTLNLIYGPMPVVATNATFTRLV